MNAAVSRSATAGYPNATAATGVKPSGRASEARASASSLAASDAPEMYTLPTPEYDFFIDEKLDRSLNRLDYIIHARGCPEGLGILDLADSKRLCECISNNRAEWFFLLPSCLPWEFDTCKWPRTIAEAEGILLDALRHFLKDSVTNANVAARFGYIDDIS